MATQEVISIVIDKIVSAFGNDTTLFENWLVRSKLETEAAALQSAIRKAQADRNADLDDAEATIQGLQSSYLAKLAEIDNL